jgi:tetratricopeptide (TPR) repeat protein
VSNPTTYENLATAYISINDAARAREAIEEYNKRFPESGTGARTLGSVLVAEGRLDEGRAMFERAEALEPLDFVPKLGLRNVAALQRRWGDADRLNQELMKSTSPFQKYLGYFASGILRAGRGRAQDALVQFETAAKLPGIAPFNRALARNRQGSLLLRLGKPGAALVQLELALPDAANRDQEFETLQLLAIAQAGAGRASDADKALARLESRIAVVPSDREKRRPHWARGQIALNRGDATLAATEFANALRTLPAHGAVIGPPSNIAAMLYDAGAAFARAGKDADAASLLERLQASHDAVFDQEAYARSHFVLAQIYERQKKEAQARAQYTKFLDLWRDGDMERGWVAEAQKKVAR